MVAETTTPAQPQPAPLTDDTDLRGDAEACTKLAHSRESWNALGWSGQSTQIDAVERFLAARAGSVRADQEALARVRRYANECAVMRVEPSTAGLRRALDDDAGADQGALAKAWSQGMNTGSSRAMRHMSDEPSLPLASEADNPYRAALAEGTDDQGGER